MIKRLAVSGFMMVLAGACAASDKSSGPIIHDGEYNFLAERTAKNGLNKTQKSKRSWRKSARKMAASGPTSCTS